MRDLIYFTQVEILKQIDLRRITRLLQDFEPDLKDTSIRPPRDENDESYFGSFAAILAQPDSLPERFHRALLSIEKAARPEHRDLVDATLQRRFPCVSLNGLCALGRAMELCISCPDELLNFPVPISAPSAINSQPSTNHDSALRTGGQSGSDHSALERLLNVLLHLFNRFVVLPKHGAETLALFVLHTYAFELPNTRKKNTKRASRKRTGKFNYGWR